MDQYHLSPPGPYPHSASIELDNPSAEFRAGEPITGRAHVTAGHGPPPRSLSIELQLAAFGEVSSVAVGAECPLPVDAWVAGQRYTHSFSLMPPCIPVPFTGKLFRTEQRVAAVLDMPDHKQPGMRPVGRAFPAASVPVLVRTESPIVVRIRKSHTRVVRVPPGCGVMFSVILTLLGLLTCGMGLGLPFSLGLDLSSGIVTGVVLCMVAACLLTVGIYLLRSSWRNWRAEARIGKPQWSLAPRIDARGGFMVVTARVPHSAEVEAIELELNVQESVQTQGDGSPEHPGWSKESPLASTRHALTPDGSGTWVAEVATSELDQNPHESPLVRKLRLLGGGPRHPHAPWQAMEAGGGAASVPRGALGGAGELLLGVDWGMNVDIGRHRARSRRGRTRDVVSRPSSRASFR